MQNNNDLKVALITGAAKRIGAVIASYFHTNGYNVIIHCNNSLQAANELAQKLNQQRVNSAQVLHCDLEQLQNITEAQLFAKDIINYYGRLDVLVNNASSFATPVNNFLLDSQNNWSNLLATNTIAPFNLTIALAGELKKNNGSVVNISDIHAQKPMKNYPVYSIAKAANDMVTKSLARELAPKVTVNAVAPGPILWPEQDNNLAQQEKEKIINRTLLKRTGNPFDIAQAVLFLSENKYITGQVLSVDGGRSIKD